jgi:hypothetical protein
MPWRTIPGIIGKVYVPDSLKSGKKHACPDCFRCQNCSSERCHVCREEKEAHERPGSCRILEEASP